MANTMENPAMQPDESTRLSQATVVRDDRIFAETRWIGLAIVAFLFVAFIMLYFFPGATLPDSKQALFAWSIAPTMTSMLMGAGYISGSYFFVSLFFGKRWHRFTWGFLAITTFTWFMAATSLIHLAKFNFTDAFPVSVVAWLGLYFTTPIIVPILWLRNRVTDPGTPEADDLVVPQSIRLATMVFGAGLLIIALFLFIFPVLFPPASAQVSAIPFWPWKLTPLTSKTVAGFFSLPGVVGLALSRDSRWSAWGALLISQAIGVALILIAALRATFLLPTSELDQSNPLTWVFMVGMFLLLLAILALYFSLESRRRKAAVVGSR